MHPHKLGEETRSHSGGHFHRAKVPSYGVVACGPRTLKLPGCHRPRATVLAAFPFFPMLRSRPGAGYAWLEGSGGGDMACHVFSVELSLRFATLV
jgi:hypothetical protein